MKEISTNNLVKLYVDEANGGEENKLLIFQVKDMFEAAKVYKAIKSKVKKIRVAYFQNGLMRGVSIKITEEKAYKLHEMDLELKEAERLSKQ